MNQHTEAQNGQQLTITLELLPDGIHEADLVIVNTVGSDIVSDLQGRGYGISPVSTGQRGGEFLVQFVTYITTTAVHLAGEAWAHKEIFERVMNDASTLVTICTSIVPLLRSLVQAHHKHAQPSSPRQILKIMVEIDGAPVTVEAEDITQAEAGLQLARRFYEKHLAAAKKVTLKSKVKVKGHVPAQTQRKRK
jgi:hypothetical protein